MKRLWPLLLLGLALASEGERYLYVCWDADQNRAFLSHGSPLPPGLAMLPRQYVELEQGRIKPKRQWQPTQGLVKVYLPWEVGRVVFSHERHFVALGPRETPAKPATPSWTRTKYGRAELRPQPSSATGPRP